MKRSRYKNYWYGICLVQVKRFPTMNETDSIQDAIFKRAITNALKDTDELPDGDLRVKLIELVYFKGDKTLDYAADDIGISYSTARRWTNSFINAVGRYAGF